MNSRLPPRWPALALSIVVASAAPAVGQDLERGRELYDRWCAGCHGVEGDGQGPAAAYMLPRPRDLTAGVYQIRTTPSGSVPTDADLIRIVEEGMPGTSMPGWKSRFSGAQIRDVVAYVKGFSPAFEREGSPEPVDFGRPPRLTDEGIAEGREFYDQIECWKCHGQAGRGDGSSAPTLQDDWDYPIRAADLTENWNFNGGGSVEEIYRRLRTGISGTPMPSFADLIDPELDFMTEEQLWHLAQYVRSLSPEDPPRAREVIRAVRIEGDLPTSPDDSLWRNMEPGYVPMVGQIIEEPRWFAPTVDGLWVSAAHNGREIAIRIAWHDPSRSPDPDWLEWQQRVAQAMYPLQDSTGVALHPDRLTVQFPTRVPTGRERPYFLMGDSRRATYLWEWNSVDDGAREARATGLDAIERREAGSQTVGASATWEAGEWRVALSRSLATADSANELQFTTGDPIPIAFFAWDGSNGEHGKQGSISSWYSIYLEPPTPTTAYVSPFLAILLTAALGLLVIWRAQRRERQLVANDSGQR